MREIWVLPKNAGMLGFARRTPAIPMNCRGAPRTPAIPMNYRGARRTSSVSKEAVVSMETTASLKTHFSGGVQFLGPQKLDPPLESEFSKRQWFS